MSETLGESERHIVEVLMEVLRKQPGILVDDHFELTRQRLGLSDSDERDDLLEQIVDEMLTTWMHWLPGDLTIHVPDTVTGVTFTHRLSEAEKRTSALAVGFDLGALSRLHEVTTTTGVMLEPFSVERGHTAWHAPDDWLDQWPAGTLLAVRPTEITVLDHGLGPLRGTVEITPIDDELPVTNEMMEAVAAAYGDEHAEPGLPVSGEQLGLWLSFHRRPVLDGPMAPLLEVCDALDLDVDGSEVADSDETWRNALVSHRVRTVVNMSDDPTVYRPLLAAVRVLDDPDATVEQVRESLAACADSELVDLLADALIDRPLSRDDEQERLRPSSPGYVFDLVHRATAVANRPREITTAEYLAAVLYERCSEPELAESHLRRALDAQPRLGPAIERLGWYHFDRGDARRALQHWQQLVDPPEAIETAEEFARLGRGGGELGRNDPCWCGSGKKYKKCHLGAAGELPPLPDRVGWLARKATLWMEHSVGETRNLVPSLIECYVTGSPHPSPEWPDLMDDLAERVDAAFDDPIIFDAALNEGGLFRRFLVDRGALLPPDEYLLASAWVTVTRSVHEILSVEPGTGLVVRDLATGDQYQVRERIFSHDAVVGARICARVVPDGQAHQLLGSVIGVPTGREEPLLDLCADGDPFELCAYIGALLAPPTIVRRPGMLDEMLDHQALDRVMSSVDGSNEDAVMAALNEELSRQFRVRWLDEQVPALGGVTPREAAADPTRREQLERLLVEFEQSTGPRMAAAMPGPTLDVANDVAWFREQLGLT